MKYTEAEVLDIIKSHTPDKTPKEILSNWVTNKANTPIDLNEWNYPYFVYTFPIIIDNKEVADITLVSLYGGNLNSQKPDLMLKYLGKEDYEKSYWAFSHDTYLDCYLTIHKEFKLPKIVKGFHGDTFQGVDANGRPFEFQVSYGHPEGEDNEHLWYKWVDNNRSYRFDNSVNVTVSQMNGWSLGQKINDNVEKRLVPYKRQDKLNDIGIS